MSGSNQLMVDTNIPFGKPAWITTLLAGQSLVISFITELELLSYAGYSDQDVQRLKPFFKTFQIVGINRKLKDKTVEIRRQHKLKLPDALIAATAIHLGLPLATADKQLQKLTELTVLPFVV